jgi:hypothetical protein
MPVRSRVLACVALMAACAPVAVYAQPAGGGISRDKSAAAAAAQRVEVDFDVLVVDQMTLAQARRAGIDQALSEAVRQVVGTKIDAMEQRMVKEGAAMDDRFMSVVQSNAAGRVIDYKVISEGLVAVPDAEGKPLNRFRGRVSALVAEEQGKSDAGFKVTVGLNRPSLLAGEELIPTVTSTRDGFLTLFIVTDDTAQVILPSQFARDNRVVAGTARPFPNQRERAMTLNLVMELPPGVAKAGETVVAVVTKSDVLYQGIARRKGKDASEVPTIFTSVNELQEWLVGIPLDERAVGFAAYEIRRAGK